MFGFGSSAEMLASLISGSTERGAKFVIKKITEKKIQQPLSDILATQSDIWKNDSCIRLGKNKIEMNTSKEKILFSLNSVAHLEQR